MGLSCRSDGHFSQVGWASFVGRMGIFRRPDGRFSQVGWALFIGRMGIFRRSAQKCRSDGQEDMPIRPIQQLLSCLQRSRVEIINCIVGRPLDFVQVRWALLVGQMGIFIGRMGIFRRSNEPFFQVGCSFFVCRKGIFRRSDRHFSQIGYGQFLYIGWAFFVCGMSIFCRLDGQTFDSQFLIKLVNI